MKKMAEVEIARLERVQYVLLFVDIFVGIMSGIGTSYLFSQGDRIPQYLCIVPFICYFLCWCYIDIVIQRTTSRLSELKQEQHQQQQQAAPVDAEHYPRGSKRLKERCL